MKTSLSHIETAMLIMKTAKHLDITYDERFITITGIQSTDEYKVFIYAPIPDAKTLLERWELNAHYYMTLKVNGATAFSNEAVELRDAAGFYKEISNIIKGENREQHAYDAFELLGKQLAEL